MGGTVRDCLSVRFCHRCEEERRISQWQWPGHHTPQILLWWKGKKNPFWNYVANVSCFITEAGLMTGINPFQVKSWFSGCHTRFPLVKLSISLSHHLSSIIYRLSSIHGWTSAFLLTVRRLCGVVQGRLSLFLPPWFTTGWQSVIRQGEIPWNTPPWLGIEPGRTDSERFHWPIMTGFLHLGASYSLFTPSCRVRF